MSTWMTTQEAVAWIMFRDEAFAASCREMKGSRFAVEMSAYVLRRDAKPFRSSATAKRLIHERCMSGRMIARGRRGSRSGAQGGHVRLQPHEWLGLKVDDNTFDWHSKNGTSSTSWYDVVFGEADVMQNFPAMPRSGIISTAAKMPAVTPAEPAAPMPAISRADIEAAYERRTKITSWSSEDDDHEFLKTIVPTIGRQRVRDIRRRLAPSSWKKSGPRPK